jgi:hypothetical protein
MVSNLLQNSLFHLTNLLFFRFPALRGRVVGLVCGLLPVLLLLLRRRVAVGRLLEPFLLQKLDHVRDRQHAVSGDNKLGLRVPLVVTEDSFMLLKVIFDQKNSIHKFEKLYGMSKKKFYFLAIKVFLQLLLLSTLDPPLITMISFLFG